jgi:hypothetical protein
MCWENMGSPARLVGLTPPTFALFSVGHFGSGLNPLEIENQIQEKGVCAPGVRPPVAGRAGPDAARSFPGEME